MQYTVKVVGDDELPAGINTVIVEQDGEALLILNGQPARVWAHMQAWQDSLEPTAMPALLYAV